MLPFFQTIVIIIIVEATAFIQHNEVSIFFVRADVAF